ncbi:MAG: PadR family transcriptional regulator [Candidatus Aminicenantes bacterium]|nr:PadR family transcriptional regulator [Candidatus Aminicenantes bacterium]
MKEITRAEEMVLLAIWRLKEKAYGVSIRRQIQKDAGKDYTYGTLYGLLRQLASKGYVHKVMGDPLPKKGGRSRTYFKLTSSGIQSLKDSLRLHRSLWKNINEFSFDES